MELAGLEPAHLLSAIRNRAVVVCCYVWLFAFLERKSACRVAPVLWPAVARCFQNASKTVVRVAARLVARWGCGGIFEAWPSTST